MSPPINTHRHESTEAVLARIDERTKGTEEDVREIKESLKNHYATQESVGVLQDQVDEVCERVDANKKEAAKTFATKESLDPVKNIVYGAVVFICVTVLGALVTLVIVKPF